MGWTSYIATHYTKAGNVDRKAEMDERWTQQEHDGYAELNVLKSSMVGSVYYAAIEMKRNGKREQVFGVVALTSTKWDDGMNFGYKDMDETCGPCYYDCPKSILDLLTPTDSEWANEWRRKCIENKKKIKLSDLPVGTHIKFTDWTGKEHRVYKHSPAYQFKRPFWMYEDGCSYCKTNRIPDSWEIVTK